MSDYDCSKDFRCPQCGQVRFIKYMQSQIRETDFSCPDCKIEMKVINGPEIGYRPWKPFSSEVHGREFPTRESFEKYCKETGCSVATAKEQKEEKAFAKHMKHLHETKGADAVAEYVKL